MKSFLSHSSKDKEFIKKVAIELGRQFCVFDEFSFDSGNEFKKSIEDGLDDSDVFVLFASKDSLESIWVDFEVDEAWYRKIQNRISKSLVYILDSSVTYSDIPDWLTRARIRNQIAPKAVAREIRFHLDELLRQRQAPFFVGRSRQIEEIERSMIPIDGSPAPRALAIIGLPGVGRRALIRKVTPGLLNLNRYLQIRISEGDSINDICAIIADYTEPYSTEKGFRRILDEIQALSDKKALKRTINNLRRAVSAGELPILFDDGGILDSEGFLADPIDSILSSMNPDDDLYTILVLYRRPQGDPSSLPPMVGIEKLSREESSRLLAVLANNAGITLSQAHISELAEYIHGYPPAAYFAVQQAKDYGTELVINNKQRLREFQTSVFLRYFSRISLSNKDERLLRLLAFYSPLPFGPLSVVINIDYSLLSQTLIRLIDHSMVVVDDRGLYRIADPISYAVHRAFGLPEPEEHSLIASSLLEYLNSEDQFVPHLDISRVLFRAARMAGDSETASKIKHLSSDLIRLTESLYHSRRYSEAIEVGYSAIEERPRSESARSYLIRALIQEERWQEAEGQLKELEHFSPRRNVLFLRGFLERNRDRIQDAIEAYSEAERLGRTDAALYRELAQCYLILRELESASQYVQKALKSHGDNPYVIDIWAKVATLQGDEASARDALSRLELIDKSFYWHRKSTVELTFGNPEKAELASDEAIINEASPPFHFFAQLCNCKIANGKLDEADSLISRLGKKYGRTHFDVRLGLQAKLAIERGHFSEALRISEKIQRKTSIQYKIIRFNAINGELKSSALRDEIRESYLREVQSLDDATIIQRPLDPLEFD